MPSENNKNKKNTNAGVNFEESLERLGEIVSKLENGKASLDESLKLFEEGVKLVRICSEKLESAEQKVKKLTYISNDPEKDAFVSFGADGADEKEE